MQHKTHRAFIPNYTIPRIQSRKKAKEVSEAIVKGLSQVLGVEITLGELSEEDPSSLDVSRHVSCGIQAESTKIPTIDHPAFSCL